MKFGFIPTEGGAFYPEALAETIYGEELGFDSVWMEEHHGIRNHYWPAPLMVLAGFATRTSRILLGTDIAVLPLYHPVRAAEDVRRERTQARAELFQHVGERVHGHVAVARVALAERRRRRQEEVIHAAEAQPKVPKADGDARPQHRSQGARFVRRVELSRPT